ncbi:MAG: dTMP kinase [Candidatus Omnitrophota bacterium]
MAKKLKKGLFITFEGPEGSGKSTHARRLQKELLLLGYDAVYTAEPGDTALGKRIRKILLEKENVKIGALPELFLFEADRAQHVEEFIRPAIIKRKIVLCDRFNTATFAYQGYGLGMDMGLIRAMDTAAVAGISPDLIVLLDVDTKTGLRRATLTRGADRMEKRSVEFHKKVRRGYLALAKKSPRKIKVIKVREEIDETYKAVRRVVLGAIEKIEVRRGIA